MRQSNEREHKRLHPNATPRPIKKKAKKATSSASTSKKTRKRKAEDGLIHHPHHSNSLLKTTRFLHISQECL